MALKAVHWAAAPLVTLCLAALLLLTSAASSPTKTNTSPPALCLKYHRTLNPLSKCSVCASAKRCKQCLAGYALDGSGSCNNLCTPGYRWTRQRVWWVLSGSPECTRCPPNYVSPGGTKAQTSCLQCPLNTLANAQQNGCFCRPGFGGPTCAKCTGYTVSSGGSLSPCTPCQAGFAPNADNTVCSVCKPGYGGSSCKACPDNTVSTGGTTDECTACPAGTAANNERTACSLCAAGYTRFGTVCQQCPAGSFKAAVGNGACSTCPANSYCPRGATAPKACTGGQISPEQSASPNQCGCAAGSTLVNGQCQACSAGSYKDAFGNVACTTCPANNYCPQGATAPTACSGDQIAPEGSASQDQCGCAAGSTLVNGQCQACSAGSYKDTFGNGACTTCPANNYCPQGATAPSACSGGQIAPEGSASQDQCGCAAGSTLVNSQCQACSAGSFKGAVGNGACTTCPANNYCPQGATAPVQCSGGQIAPEGSTSQDQCSCAAGSTLSSGQCQQCAAGSFKGAVGNGACSTCPANNYCPAGATGPTPCPGGQIAPEGSSSESQCGLPPRTGIIRVTTADTGAALGYVSRNFFNNAQSRVQPDIADALHVTIPGGTNPAARFNMRMVNGPSNAYPFFGAVQGRDNTNNNLAAGSYHYLYLAGTAETPADARPATVGNTYTAATGTSRTSESVVWSIAADNRLTMSWVNSDGSRPPVVIGTQSTALYVWGDQAAFTARYPAPTTAVRLTFEDL